LALVQERLKETDAFSIELNYRKNAKMKSSDSKKVNFFNFELRIHFVNIND